MLDVSIYMSIVYKGVVALMEINGVGVNFPRLD